VNNFYKQERKNDLAVIGEIYFPKQKRDDNFSIIGELALIEKIVELRKNKKYQEAISLITSRKIQHLPQYLYWFFHYKTLKDMGDDINANFFLLQIVLYSRENSPDRFFSSIFSRLLIVK
jgi:hypothetical protein